MSQAILIGVLLAAALWALDRSDDPAPKDEDARTVGRVSASSPATGSTTLYKWKDDSGVWNYTDRPPADRPFERITGTPNVNSVPTVVPDNGLSEPSATPTH